MIACARDGGCNFAIDPSLDATQAAVYWAPDADPFAIILSAAPAVPGLGAPRLSKLNLESARQGEGGINTLLEGDERVRLLITGEIAPEDRLAAVVPLGPDALDRLDAAERLWRVLHGLAISHDPRLTANQRRRLRRMLQAVDGRAKGASYREIANAIFGAERVADQIWKTSSLRDVTIDLVKDGLAMIAGGYRRLLRQRRR